MLHCRWHCLCCWRCCGVDPQREGVEATQERIHVGRNRECSSTLGVGEESCCCWWRWCGCHPQEYQPLRWEMRGNPSSTWLRDLLKNPCCIGKGNILWPQQIDIHQMDHARESFHLSATASQQKTRCHWRNSWIRWWREDERPRGRRVVGRTWSWWWTCACWFLHHPLCIEMVMSAKSTLVQSDDGVVEERVQESRILWMRDESSCPFWWGRWMDRRQAPKEVAMTEWCYLLRKRISGVIPRKVFGGGGREGRGGERERRERERERE